MEPKTGRIPAPAPMESVVDTTGAGDSFLSGFLSDMLRIGGFASFSDAEVGCCNGCCRVCRTANCCSRRAGWFTAMYSGHYYGRGQKAGWRHPGRRKHAAHFTSAYPQIAGDPPVVGQNSGLWRLNAADTRYHIA